MEGGGVMEETHGFLAISGIVGFLYHNQAVTSVDLVRKTRMGKTINAITADQSHQIHNMNARMTVMVMR
jgi:hypothetical protein